METVTKKMSFNEYWESVVGKVAQLQEDIKTKNEELTSTLLALIEKHGVVPEDSQEKETSETENTQNQEPYFTLPLTSEQYKLLRTWIDAKDYIELATYGQDKVMLINSPKLDRKNHPGLASALGGELLDFRIRLLSPFIDFIEKYLDFFNEPGSLEASCTSLIIQTKFTLHQHTLALLKMLIG